MKTRKLVFISFITGFVSTALGDRLLGGSFGRFIGLACGLGILTVIYLATTSMFKKKKESKQKRRD